MVTPRVYGGSVSSATADTDAAQQRRSGSGVVAPAVWLTVGVAVLFVVAFRSLWSVPIRLAGFADMHWFFGPMQFFFDSRLDAGDFPLWNSMTYSGEPFAAHPLVMAFYPPNLIRSVLVTAHTPADTLASLSLLSLFHLWLMACGMYGLARQEGISPPTAAVVGLATAFSHPVLFGVVGNLAFLYTVAWVPVVMLCLARAAGAVRLRARTGWLLTGGLVYGWQILAGIHQIPLYATVAYLWYAAVRLPLWRKGVPAQAAARRALGWMAGMGLFGAVAVLVAAALVLPSLELFEYSARSPEHFRRFARAVGGVDHSLWGRFIYLARSIAAEPGIATAQRFGDMVSDQYLTLNVGMIVVGTAAFLAGVGRRAAVYASLFYLLFDLCLGPPMPIARVVTSWVSVVQSSSSYASILLIVPLGILAGLGLEQIFGRAGPRGLPVPVRISLSIVGAGLIWLLPEPAGGLIDWSLRWALLPLGVLATIVVSSRWMHYRGLVLTVLVLETVVCSLALAERQYRVRPLTITAESLRQTASGTPNRARTLALSHNDNLWSLRRAINGYDPMVLDATSRVLVNPGEEDVFSRALTLSRNRRAVALLKRRYWLASFAVRGGLPKGDRLFPPTKVVFWKADADGSRLEPPRPQLPEMSLDAVPDSTLAEPEVGEVLWTGVSRNSLRLPSVALPARNSALLVDYVSREPAHFTVRFAGRGKHEYIRFNRVRARASGRGPSTIEFPLPDFEVVDIAIELRGDQAVSLRRVAIAVDHADETDRIEVLDEAPDRSVVRLRDLPEPRALVFADAAYPGWQAHLDDVEVPIHIVDGAFKAVWVPRGTHSVRFEFRPWRVRVGSALSIAATAAVLLSIFWCFRTDRQRTDPDAR